MKVSKNWLCEYLDIEKISDDELYDIFTAHVCEIETMDKLINKENIVIAKVLECEDIPETHLHKCLVDVGRDVRQIVCGAPNVCAGVKVICALPGAVLPGNFKIKESKIRGVESRGMLCSLQELGVEEKYVPEDFKLGIYLINDDNAILGNNAIEYLNLDDTVYDLEVTSNRSDLLSIEGVAYDLGAAINQLPKLKTFELKESKELNPINVSIETPNCHKYLSRYIKNVKIKESPMWLKAKLVKSGIRPINNVVDITNLVLMELGQPLHSFDADKLGNNIVVRMANYDEKLVTLDDIERKLDGNDIVITNGKEAVCVAGVMGGKSTEIDENTKNVVLEAAYFDALSIRRTSSKLNLKSESSQRFERKIDYNRVDKALDYAAYLMQELADGEVLKGVNKSIKVDFEEKNVSITLDKINGVLGTKLSSDYIESLFNRLQYNYSKNGKTYEIIIPSRRMDLEASAQDIIEDVARMYGYDNIPTTIAKTRDKGGLTFSQKRTRLVRQILAFDGLNEVVSYSLIKEADLGLYVENVKEPIKVLMPLTEDRAVMRQSLLNGLVDAIQYNKARKNENIALFEIGNVYAKNYENLHLAVALNGLYSSNLWAGDKQLSSFFVLKGLIESLFSKLNFAVAFRPYNGIKSFHPGRCAEIIHRGNVIGYIAELHPKFAKERGISNTVVCEITLDGIINEENGLKYHPINKYPSISRDLAIVVKKNVLSEDVLASIKKAARGILTNISLFDLYVGENIAEDEKSLAFSLTFEDFNKTLESEEIDKVIEDILAKLKKDFNARLR